jgi:signal transduction histidine kinase
MPDESKFAGGAWSEEPAMPDPRELCRIHDIDPELIARSRDLVDLLGLIIEEKSRRRQDDVLAELDRGVDTAELRQIEEMQKMLQELGVLSHKINNPLTSLMGRAQLLRVSKDTDPKTRKAAEVIEESAKRIADYIRELANLVREGREVAERRLRELEAEGKD